MVIPQPLPGIAATRIGTLCQHRPARSTLFPMNAITRRWFTGALTAAASLALLTPGSAAATNRFPAVLNGHAPSLHPEGVAFDPTRGTFLVGSLKHGTVSIVNRDGSATTLVDDTRMAGTVGLRVDAPRGRVLVCYADTGISDHSTPERHTGLGIVDLRTGRVRHLIELGTGTHVANDVTIDRAGNAYVTDSGGDTIYRVDPAGHATAVVSDPRFASTSVGINGIAWHPGGYLLVGHYATGTLFRVTLGAHPEVTEVAIDRALVGADGLALRPNGTLAVVTNHIGSSGEEAVTVLASRTNWRTAHEVAREPWPVSDPTTIAVSPFGDYVVSGDLSILINTGQTTDNFTLRRRTTS
jgi:sugar lactone lactonase YvrE